MTFAFHPSPGLRPALRALCCGLGMALARGGVECKSHGFVSLL